MTSRNLILGLCGLCLAMSTPACGGDGNGPESGADHMKVVVLPYLTMAPFYIAAEEGFFAEQNLEVEFVRLARNQEIMTSLARGEVDVASGLLTLSELRLAEGGERVRMVADLGHVPPDHCTFMAFIARREHLESGALADPARIREMLFDIPIVLPFGYWMDEFLRPLDLTIDDLEIVDLPSTVSIPAIIDGSLDISVESEPYLSEALRSGEVVVWEDVSQILPNTAVSMVMYGPSLLDERPEVGERFAVALLKAVRQYGEGKTPRNLEILERGMGLSREQLTEACWSAMRLDGRIDTESVRGYQEWNVSRGLLGRVLADHEIFDHRFIDHADEVLGR